MPARKARSSSLRWRLQVVAVLAGAIAGAFAVTSFASSSAGSPPPEVTPEGDGWPAHNYDLSNSRATTHTQIDASNVGTLKEKWRFKIPGTGIFGNYATTPVVLNGVVYFQDLNSNVYALDEQTGAMKWKHAFNAPSIGPNGVSFGYGRLYGATEKFVFALDPATGAVVWRHTLTPSVRVGIDMAPQLYDGKVLVSTVPGSGVKHFYEPNAVGVVYALDATTGKTDWTFKTVLKTKGVLSGGGLWYPPAVDSQGNVYLAVANPGLWPNSPKSPNGALRPGPNLYTDSLVVLDGATGKLKWFRQVIPHDVRDYDLQISPVLFSPAAGGTQLVIGAGKMGKVFAWNSATGAKVWQANVGRHLNDTGLLPKKKVTVCPGDYGGVETPMAQSGGTLFVPWVNLCAVGSATSESIPQSAFGSATGGLTAFDAGTGKVKWQAKLPHADFGAATVANDVVFTSDFTGKIYAFSATTGKRLSTLQAPAGVNGFPAVTDKLLLVGAGTAGLGTIRKPVYSLVAYSLP